VADASTITSVAYIYKHRYSDRQVSEVALREHPTFMRIPKESAFDGQDFIYAITTGNPQGIGSTFSAAQGAAESLKGGQLAATPFLKYGVCTLDGPSMMRARGSKASFYNLVTRTQNGILDEQGAALAFDVFGDGSGMRGQISAINGNVLMLTNKRDVEHFKRGMSLGAAQNADGTSARVTASRCKVTGLDRANAKVTVDNAAGITSLSVNDYLFRAGDEGGGMCMLGMGKSTPLTAPTSGDSFRGLDRSVDVEALAGSRINDTSRYPEEVLGDLGVEISIIGKSIDYGSVFPSTFKAMADRLGAKVEYEAMKGPAGASIGFSYLTLVLAGGGQVRIIADPDCRSTETRLMRQDTHCIKHMDDLVHIIRDDGRPSLRDTSSDGLEIRSRSLMDYIQYDPSCHGVAACKST
jgi:hypothetical protein